MTREQKFLMEILTVSSQGEQVQTLPEQDLDWEGLMQEAYAQAVHLQCCDALSPVLDQIPEPWSGRLVDGALRSASANIYVEQGQAMLVRELEKGEYPYVILKGKGIAAYYPKPEIRIMGDVDFLIPVDRMDQLTQTMEPRGFVHTFEEGEHHRTLTRDKLVLEMHIEVAGVPESNGRREVEAFMESIYRDRMAVTVDGATFYAPSHAHHAVIQLLHIQHHVVQRGMGLRHILDWACFMNKTVDAPFWEEQLLPLMRSIGLFHFTAVVTKMCAIYFKSPCPDWAAYVEEDLCRDMMEDILAGGNFGRKNYDHAMSLSMLPDWEKDGPKSGKVRRLYEVLRGSVVKTHPKLEHKPIRLHIYMTGKAIRFIFLYFQGKRVNLFKAATHADARRSVYERLRMFEKE